MSHATEVALVHQASATFVVPVHTPYDRQMLREHLETLATHGAPVTLDVDGTRWTIERHTPTHSPCRTCARFLGRLSCSRSGAAEASCLHCAIYPGAAGRRRSAVSRRGRIDTP